MTSLYHSGWRVSEMRALEWRDVDLAGKVVRLRPEISKNKDGRLLPIKGEHLEIIERAKRKRRLDCPYVFHVDGQHIGSLRKAWKTACVAAGLGSFVEQPQHKLTPDTTADATHEGQVKARKKMPKKRPGHNRA